MKFLIDQRAGGNLSAFARSCKVSADALQKGLRRLSMPDARMCAAVAKAVPCSLVWLITGEGEPFGDERPVAAVPTYITGGGNHWIVADDLEPYETKVPGGLLAFEVRGDSMEDVVRDGQIVLAMPNVEPKDGDLAVVELTSGQHTFKRVYFRSKGKQRWIVLDPVNPRYEPELVRRSEIRRMMRIWGVKY